MTASEFTLTDTFAGNARRFAASPACIDGATTMSHADLWARSGRLAAGLRAAGVTRGDRISLLAQNRAAFLDLLAAAARLGAILAPINWRLSPAEVAQVIASDAPRLVLADDSLWPLLDEVLAKPTPQPEPVCIGGPREGYRSLEVLYADGEGAPEGVGADDPLLLIHTAWTDGQPKAATLSHRNLLAGALQLQTVWRLGPDDVHLCCLPLFHITAISLMLATLLAGGRSVLQPKFDAAEVCDAMERQRATVFGEFAPMLGALLDQPGGPERLASLRHVCGLDAPETIRRFQAACPQAKFWSGYGQSECTGLASLAPFDAAAGSVGHPLPLCAVSVVDELDAPVPAGIEGEIALRGPTVFVGYWNRPADTAWALRAGWLHTGDKGRLDEQGRLWYTGRMAAKALIKTGGENVYPAEVEAVLREHPGIEDAAVIGVPDAKWGEAVQAVCVAKGSTEPPSEQALIEFVGARIAHFKRPRRAVFVPGLPRKADGSVDRDELRLALLKCLADA